ncbi:MAG: hypothetical protein KDD47_09345 [Acidobacteria bacterium]|nr:hypothetical protein [Acidobacteriota bacterium]
MPTLQRYKKLYQARIPSEGKGRKQRYPAEALKVFEEIKEENIGRRGRPRKDASAAPAPRKARGAAKKSTRKAPAKKVASTRKRTAAKKAEAAAESSTGLLTLAEIGRRTGISYPTLSRYVKQYGDRLKSEGAGRARRFYEEAVEVFHELRSQTGRGRKAGAAAGKKAKGSKPGRVRGRAAKSAAPATDADLAKRVADLEKQLKALERKLARPVRFTVLPK